MYDLFPDDLSIVFYVEKFYDLFQQLDKSSATDTISERQVFLNNLVKEHPEFIIDLKDIEYKKCYLMIDNVLNVYTPYGKEYGTILAGGMISIQTKIIREDDKTWDANISGFVIEKDRHIFAGHCMLETIELKDKLIDFQSAIPFVEYYLKSKQHV